MRFLALILCVACVSIASDSLQAADPAGASSVSKLPPVRTGIKTLLPANQATTQTTKSRNSKAVHTMTTLDMQAGLWFVLKLEFETPEACRAFNVEGAHLITRFDRFADIFAAAKYDKDVDDVVVVPDVEKAISEAPGLLWYDIASTPILPPLPREPVSDEKTRAIQEPDKIASGGIGKYTGKGVVIAVVDSGIDFRHPDFITKDSTGKEVSRLMYFWDTTSEQYKTGTIGQPAPYTYPNDKPGHPSNIGTIFNRDELTRNLQTRQPEIPEWDTNGHGTSCAGIAAGNGQGGPKDSQGHPLYAGVAPEADLIGVRIGTSESLENAYLLGAVCDWLNQVVGDRPLVISCSFGGHDGGHDGYLVAERELDARFPLTAKGRAICIAGGNEGQNHFHADLTIGGEDKPAKLRWKANHSTDMKIYLQTDQIKDLVVDFDQSASIYRDSIDVALHPLTKQVIISMNVASGEGKLCLYSKDGRTIAGDTYFFPDTGAEFDDKESDSATTGYSPRNQIGTPGSCNNAITVGSYDWNDRFDRFGKIGTLRPVNHLKPDMMIGALSDYSNPGFLRVGKSIKPEIVAPGQWYTAPIAINVPAERDTTGLYRQFNGTSAATPYTAGVVALLMQKNPKITLSQIKQALAKAASKPSKQADPEHASPLPNPYWGYGKLDRAAVERLLQTKP